MQLVNRFFIFLEQSKTIQANPCSALVFPYPKEKRCERLILTKEEIKLLYQSAENAQQRAILSLAYGCGLRAEELQNCNCEDIRLQEKIIIIPKGKGNKKRVVPLSKGVIKDLSEYYYHQREVLRHERNYTKLDNAFMLNARGGRMMKWTYNNYLKQIIERTDNQTLIQKQLTIHSLRHSIATHLLEQGVKIEQVRLFLGHSQLETTQIYTHIGSHQLAVISQYV